MSTIANEKVDALAQVMSYTRVVSAAPEGERARAREREKERERERESARARAREGGRE